MSDTISNESDISSNIQSTLPNYDTPIGPTFRTPTDINGVQLTEEDLQIYEKDVIMTSGETDFRKSDTYRYTYTIRATH